MRVRLFRAIGRLGDINCDRMTIVHPHGNTEDVGIYEHDGRRIAARWVTSLVLTAGPSPASNISSHGGWSLGVMNAENQARILAIYDEMMAPSPPS